MVFLKTLQKSIFVDCYLFSYFHGSVKKPVNLQESIREKTHLARIHLRELIFVYQNKSEYFWQ